MLEIFVFCVVTGRGMVGSWGRLGTTYRFYLQGSNSPRRTWTHTKCRFFFSQTHPICC